MEEYLINLVRSEPAIYDKSNRNYKDRNGVVANIWKKIAEQMVEAGYKEFEGKINNNKLREITLAVWFVFLNFLISSFQ